MNKRFLAVLLVAVLLCLTGCSQKKVKDVNLPYDDLKSEAMEPTELQFYTQGTAPSYGKEAIEGMLSQIGAATRETINVTPVFNWVAYEKYDMEIPQLIASGEKIDAFTCFSPQPYVDQELCMDVTELFKQYAPTYASELMTNQVGKDYLTDSMVDGKLYVIPNNAIRNPRIGVVAKADLVAKHAPDGLETLEDYGEFLRKIKENEPKLTPGVVYAYEFFQAYLQGNGYYSNWNSLLYTKWEENGKTMYAIEQIPEFADAFELILLWKNRGYVLKNNQQAGQLQMSSGLLGSQLIYMDNLKDGFTYNYGSNDQQLRVIPLYMQSLHLLNTSPRGLVISHSCRNPERVMMFLEWLHGAQENYDLFMYGQEGVNFTLKDGNMALTQPELQPLDLWRYFGAAFFEDYRYERYITNLDPDLQQVYQDSSFQNVRTKTELEKEMQNRFELDEAELDELEKEKPQFEAIVDMYFGNYERFTQSIDSGVFNIMLEELKKKQKETGIEKVLDFYRKAMGL